MQINKCNPHINRIKNENHMVISIDAEKACNTIQHNFMIKIPEEIRKRMYFNIVKGAYDKPITSIILNGENLKYLL
jgi:hypothetical protein